MSEVHLQAKHKHVLLALPGVVKVSTSTSINMEEFCGKLVSFEISSYS